MFVRNVWCIKLKKELVPNNTNKQSPYVTRVYTMPSTPSDRPIQPHLSLKPLIPLTPSGRPYHPYPPGAPRAPRDTRLPRQRVLRKRPSERLLRADLLAPHEAVNRHLNRPLRVLRRAVLRQPHAAEGLADTDHGLEVADLADVSS